MRPDDRDGPVARGGVTPAGRREPTEASPGVEPAFQTFRRGIALSPELFSGLAGTIGFAAAATAGKVAIPIAIQLGIDQGLRAAGGPDVPRVALIAVLAAVALVITAFCGYAMNVRLYRVSETALANLRTRTFRHIHDLSIADQQRRRRGALVSRVTSDIDQLSQFLQRGGVVMLVSLGQVVLTTAVMMVYSWRLTALVLVTVVPLLFAVRLLQGRLHDRFARSRRRVADLLAVVGESVVGASVIRAYGVRARAESRLDTSIERNRVARFEALRTSVASSVAAETFAGVATAAVVVAGVVLGAGGDLTVGRLTAFLFLVALFTQPAQVATEVVNEAQNAIAGWRRVLDILDTRPEVEDPGEAGLDLPPGPLAISFHQVCHHYPGGPEVLSDIDFEIPARRRVAVVGQTGGGKTTLAKLLVRLMDPASGVVSLSGVPLPSARITSLRRRVAMVPQDGFLFSGTIAENVRFGAIARQTGDRLNGGPPAAGASGGVASGGGASEPDSALSDEALGEVFVTLGLGDWVKALPRGLDTPVGERGESLSVGERQLVALARAYVADPDLLILDEATSAVDPATEARLQRALDTVTAGRTTVTIAHRLATARSADEVVVIDHGRVAQRGPHAELVADQDSVYARLHASWLALTR